MNKKYIIANWKMQLGNSEAEKLASSMARATKKYTKKRSVEVVLCPTFTALAGVGRKIKSSGIKLGAQNVFYHEKGQYTGEVSVRNLKEIGVEYVIVGHSERRKYLAEDDEDLNKKIRILLENKITPVVCIGESLDDRNHGKAEVAIMAQLNKAMEDVELKDGQKMIIAYEPVWAISPAPPASPEDAEDATEMIRHYLKEFFSAKTIEEQIVTVYGGSVDDKNIASFMKDGLIDGGLVGGASLDKDKMVGMVEAVI